MEEFLKEKRAWIEKMKWGDMAEAARIAGVTRPTFQEWMLNNEVKRSGTEKRNLLALKKAVRKREKELGEAVSA